MRFYASKRFVIETECFQAEVIKESLSPPPLFPWLKRKGNKMARKTPLIHN
jgi:hypothetical protein